MKSKKEVKKILFLFYLLFCILFLLTGCGYTKEEKNLIKQYKIQGKENAINYVKEKYEMDAKVKSVLVYKHGSDLSPDFFSKPTGIVQVKMKANGKKFSVYITGTEKSTDGKDNYQFDEITNALVNSIDNLVPIQLHKYEISTSKTADNLEGLLNKDKYYNGNNLTNIIEDMGLSLFMHYIGDVDFNSIDFSSISDITENIYVLMLNNYSSESNYENSIKLTSNLQLFSPNSYFEAGGDYIKSTMSFYKKEKQYFKNTIDE